MSNPEYCNSLSGYSRLDTRTVSVGNIPLGGSTAIRIQSMTNTETRDVAATVSQCRRIFDEGADFIRITIPSVKDIEYLENIKKTLHKEGYTGPLIADVHFNPRAAEKAACVVEKVRINPGNYADAANTVNPSGSPDDYQVEGAYIRNKLVPLLDTCKKCNTALRIGVNHGSLSGRIISRYGDTPLGMAESAMEYIRICHKESFDNLVVSIKASNTIIMVHATRLLVNRMISENMVYPLHLGVTEAGEGEDGRLKSAVGIGALLVDGIGDTIRVSLTEEPEKEIPVAGKLIDCIAGWSALKPVKSFTDYPGSPFDYRRRKSTRSANIGDSQLPVVIGALSAGAGAGIHSLNTLYNGNQVPDYVFFDDIPGGLIIPESLKVLTRFGNWQKKYLHDQRVLPVLSCHEYLRQDEIPAAVFFVQVAYPDISPAFIQKIKSDRSAVLVAAHENQHGFYGQRALVFELINSECYNPVVFRNSYNEQDPGNFQQQSAANLGPLFIDGLGDGLWLENDTLRDPGFISSTAFGILQASRARITRTEYISCPSCGRTYFNLIETSARIREKTAHLKGLKIGIMGCIVNGIGEMADADYGYVGAARGKITLYKARQVVKRNIPEEDAVKELINLIRENGDWVNP